MAAPTATQQLYDLNAITNKMEQQIENLMKAQEELQQEMAKLRDALPDVRQQVAAIRQQSDDTIKRIDKWDNRIWAFVGALLTMAAGLIATLSGLRKTP